MRAKQSIFLIFLSVLLISGCFFLPGDGCKYEVLDRSLSPNKLVEAVYEREGCGATTGFGYQIRLVPFESESFEQDWGMVFYASKIDGLQTRWLNDRHFEIAFDKAKIHRYSNHWRSYWEDPKYEIRITLAPSDMVK